MSAGERWQKVWNPVIAYGVAVKCEACWRMATHTNGRTSYGRPESVCDKHYSEKDPKKPHDHTNECVIPLAQPPPIIHMSFAVGVHVANAWKRVFAVVVGKTTNDQRWEADRYAACTLSTELEGYKSPMDYFGPRELERRALRAPLHPRHGRSPRLVAHPNSWSPPKTRGSLIAEVQMVVNCPRCLVLFDEVMSLST